MSGRWADARRPTRQELKATAVLSLPLDEASAKVRVGPPLDEQEDYALPVWAGVLPLSMTALSPIADPGLAQATAVPSYVTGFDRPRKG